VAVKVTVTSVLFQPSAFGGGVTVAETEGGVLSKLITTFVDAAFPALSIAVPVMT